MISLERILQNTSLRLSITITSNNELVMMVLDNEGVDEGKECL